MTRAAWSAPWISIRTLTRASGANTCASPRTRCAIIAEETGGIALVNSNDYDKGIKRIDNESSDYYVLGYYSSNPDRTRARRKIEVKITRKGVTSVARQEYLIKPTQIVDPRP